MSGGYRQDTAPRFPFPEKFILRSRGSQSNPRPLADDVIPTDQDSWRRLFPTSNPLNGILDDIQTALNHAKMRSARNELWIKVEFASLWIDPISWKLLGLKRDVDPNDSPSIIQEATRLSIILFFGEIRRKCGALAVSTLVHMKKHKALMISVGMDADWSMAQPLLLWVIFFGFFESWQQPEYDWYLGTLVRAANNMRLLSWDEVVNSVRSFLWLGPIHNERLGKFRESFESEMGTLADSSISTSSSSGDEQSPSP